MPTPMRPLSIIAAVEAAEQTDKDRILAVYEHPNQAHNQYDLANRAGLPLDRAVFAIYQLVEAGSLIENDRMYTSTGWYRKELRGEGGEG